MSPAQLVFGMRSFCLKQPFRLCPATSSPGTSSPPPSPPPWHPWPCPPVAPRRRSRRRPGGGMVAGAGRGRGTSSSQLPPTAGYPALHRLQDDLPLGHTGAIAWLPATPGAQEHTLLEVAPCHFHAFFRGHSSRIYNTSVFRVSKKNHEYRETCPK